VQLQINLSSVENQDFLDPLFGADKTPEQKKKLLKEVMNESWNNLNKDVELILDNFIIYVTKDQTYIVPPEGTSRVKYLDFMIEFFQNKEEFEKCAHLLKVKNKILANIKKF
jgi:hypothetical protein